MTSLLNAQLYGILDLGYVLPEDAEGMTARMLEGGVQVLQLRAKRVPVEELSVLARVVAGLCQGAGVPFIINDYPGLAKEVGATGVHVGQDDLGVDAARELAGVPLVGKSTHSLTQAAAAAADGADYIGFGPLFATPTKPDYVPIGVEEIRAVHELVRVPIFCIGGIKKENLAPILEAGARRVVIVSGILQAADVVGYCREVREMLAGVGL
jgi:thiamine-phosphate pyrophosphorylase